MKPRALFYCQSVLGVGHFIRSRELVLALEDFEICFLYGGEVVAGFELPPTIETVHLPALKTDENFGSLQALSESLDLEQTQAARKELLISTFDRFRPDVLIIELFPFGRKKFSFELLPLLEHARQTRPEIRIACSLRDILVSKKNQSRFEADVCDVMNRYFDLLLVHADPRLTKLEESFGSVEQLQCPIRYTGFVTRRSAPGSPVTSPGDESSPLILTSVGGGRVGFELIDCALAASEKLLRPHQMHIIGGPYMPVEIFERFKLAAAARSNVSIERHTTDFIGWLNRARLSISLAGYNTCGEILAAGTPALVFPFTGGGDNEQTVRARKLETLGLVRVLHPNDLAPTTLAEIIAQALTHPPAPSPVVIDFDGAKRSAQFLMDLLEGL
jgi:predicted glycosyltransferase